MEDEVGFKMKMMFNIIFRPFIYAKNIIYEGLYSGRDVQKFHNYNNLYSLGYSVMKEKLSHADINLLRKDFELLQTNSKFEEKGQLSGRLYEHGPISELSKKYIGKYRPIAEAYFSSKRIHCELTMYQKSWPKAKIDDVPGGEFHEDDSKRNLKFFIYLTDVDKNSGPFCYVPRTHGLRKSEKYFRWLLWEIFHERKYLYNYKLNTKECEEDEIQILGSAGTCFCCDTTGYHRAAMPLNQNREVFVVSFTRSSKVDYLLNKIKILFGIR